MKTVSIPAAAGDLHELLQQARDEDILARVADGTEFLIALVDEFDLEMARTRTNSRLIDLLEKRARQSETVPLADVKRQLGLDVDAS